MTLSHEEKVEIAKMVAHFIQQDTAAALPPDYDATRRLSRKDAARHMGVSPATIDNWSNQGVIKRHRIADGKDPFWILGELDAVVRKRGARGYGER